MKPAVTADGTTIRIVLNIADPRELSDLDPAICDGIGLVRTEFLFHNQQGLPDEEQQYSTYRRIVEWAHDRPVTIRTLDAGGDKPIPGLTPTGESNPFLGVRGLRLSLAQPDVFRTQLRALARAAMHGNVKIMLPMVTHPRELAIARHEMLQNPLRSRQLQRQDWTKAQKGGGRSCQATDIGSEAGRRRRRRRKALSGSTTIRCA